MVIDLDKTVTARLFNPERRGTLILGSPRMGTHYLLEVCRAWAQQAGLSTVYHGELNPAAPRSVQPENLADFMLDDTHDGYRLVIINHEYHKTVMLADTLPASQWHVVRLIDHDKHRWFWSWFWFMHSPLIRFPIYPELLQGVPGPGIWQGRSVWIDSHDNRQDIYDANTHAYIHTRMQGIDDFYDKNLSKATVKHLLGHHDSSRELYDRFLAQIRQKLPISRLLVHLTSALNNQLLGQLIPVDEELEYPVLADVGRGAVEWLPNDYENIDPESVFDHGALVRAILDRWSVPYPGNFKESV